MCQGIKKGLDLEVAEGVQRQLASARAIEGGAIGSYHILGIGELTGCQIECSVLGGREILANEIAVDSDDVRGIAIVGVELADEEVGGIIDVVKGISEVRQGLVDVFVNN